MWSPAAIYVLVAVITGPEITGLIQPGPGEALIIPARMQSVQDRLTGEIIMAPMADPEETSIRTVREMFTSAVNRANGNKGKTAVGLRQTTQDRK